MVGWGKCCHLATALTPEPEPNCLEFHYFLVQLCPRAGAKGSDLSPGVPVAPTEPREGPLTGN